MCGGGAGTTGGSLSPDWATRPTHEDHSLEEICLLSLPTEELEIIDFWEHPKDHASAEADSFWPLDQVHIFCHFWGLLW